MEFQIRTSSVKPDLEHQNGSSDQSKRQSIGNGKDGGEHCNERSQVECKPQFEAVVARSDLFDNSKDNNKSISGDRSLGASHFTSKSDQKRTLSLENGLYSSDYQNQLDDKPKEPFRFAGYLCTVLVSLISSASYLFIKLLPVEDNFAEKVKVIFTKGLMVSFFCGITMCLQGHTFKIARGEYLLNFFRCLTGVSGLVFAFIGIMYITIGESTTIINSSCVWTCVLSFIFLREPLPISLVVAMPLSFLGMVLLAHPDLILDTRNDLAIHHISHLEDSNSSHMVETFGDFNATAQLLVEDEVDEQFFQHRWPGFVCALCASILWASVTILLKFRKKTPIVTCSFYCGIAHIIIALVLALYFGLGAMPTTALELVLHFGIGITAFISQYLFQWGLLFVPAGTYSVVRQLDIVFSFLFGIVFLDDIVLWTSVAGSVLIMIVVPLLVLNDHFVRGIKSLCLKFRVWS